MKVTSVVLHNIHAHRDTTWSPNGARLVALTGANGAGKSTLASDALRYALYGELREGPDWIVTLGETEGSVLVTFEYGGQTYRAVRQRSTRSGGKSSLEFAIADGDAWRPLTGDSIRETQAAIAALLQMDAASFDSAVVLAQGRITALSEGTAAERKRVVGQVLGLEQYERAEAQAREEARDVEARVKADRDVADHLDAEVFRIREADVDDLANAKGLLEQSTTAIATTTTARDGLDVRIREGETKLAAAKAIADQVATLQGEKKRLGEQWHAARERVTTAQAEITRLEALQADRAEVDAAAEALPPAKAGLEQLVAGEAEERRLQREIADMDRAIRDLEAPHQQAVATWTAQHTAAAAKVTELEAHTKAGAAVCEACGQPVDRITAIAQLTAARLVVKNLGERPQEPIAIARARAGRIRLQDRAGELAWDPQVLVTQREFVEQLTAIAARREGIDAAAASIARERQAITAAEVEQSTITERGRAIASEISALQPRLEGLAEAEAAVASARKDRQGHDERLQALEGDRRRLERAIAAGEERLAIATQREQQAAEIRTRIAADELQGARLRKQVEAFGVKGIPARIVAGVVPELERYGNELLGELRPGMSMSIETQRAKKSGDGVIEALDLVVRDAAGERPLALFSGGERTSVALALGVALSRLVARRAGARIESLVIDEPDGLDGDARRSFGQALRVIAHRGDLSRVVLVSHHADLAEFADETYQVTKGPQGSVVEQVA